MKFDEEKFVISSFLHCICDRRYLRKKWKIMSLRSFIEALACPGQTPDDVAIKLRRTIGRVVFPGRKMITQGDSMKFISLYAELQLKCMKFYIIFILMMN